MVRVQIPNFRQGIFRAIKSIGFALALALLWSCRTAKLHELDPFAAIGGGADVYLFIPAAGNEDFLEMVLGERVDRHDIQAAIHRTKYFAVGIFTAMNNARKLDETRLCAVGKYPANMAGALFKEKNGWTKFTAENGVNYYSGGISAVSIPNNSAAFLALSEKPETSMKAFLENVHGNEPVGFSEKFDLFIKGERPGTVGLFIKNPNFLLASFLGADLKLPVNTSEIYLRKSETDETYRYNFSIETGNKMTAFALSLLLRGTLNAQLETKGATVFIEDGKLTKEEIAAILKKIF